MVPGPILEGLVPPGELASLEAAASQHWQRFQAREIRCFLQVRLIRRKVKQEQAPGEAAALRHLRFDQPVGENCFRADPVDLRVCAV